MSSTFFKEHEKLGDSSNFAAWKVRLEVITDNNDVLDFIQGRVLEPPENASAIVKYKHKKCELKAKQIIADGLQDNLLAYVGILRRPKDMYDKITCMYEVNNLNEIISLKDQLKDMKMNKGESVQSYIMRISRLSDQLLRVGEITPDRELVIVTLRGLSPIWETFITSIRNNNNIATFDEPVGKLTEEEFKDRTKGSPLPVLLKERKRMQRNERESHPNQENLLNPTRCSMLVDIY